MPADAELDPVQHFVHIGFINFSTWHYTVLRLYSDLDMLEISPDVVEDTGALQVGALSSHLAAESLGVQTDLQFYKDALSLELSWKVTPYVISSEESHWVHTGSDVSLVPLIPLPDVSAFCVWRGSVLEAAHRAPPPKKRGADARAAHGSGAHGSGPGNKRRTTAGGQASGRALSAADGEAAAAASLVVEQGATDWDVQDLVNGPYAEEATSVDAAHGWAAFEIEEAAETADVAPSSLADEAKKMGWHDKKPDSDNDGSDDSLDPLFADYNPDGESLGHGEHLEDRLVAGEVADEVAADAEAPGPSAAGPRAGGHGPMALDFEKQEFKFSGHGRFRYYKHTKALIAVCPLHADCRMERTCRAREGLDALGAVNPKSMWAGQGRPIGILGSWLKAATEFDTQQAHIKNFRHTHECRLQAREEFMCLPGAAEFSRMTERVRRRDEPEEPERIR